MKLEALYRMRLAPDAMRERKRAELEALRPWLASLRGFEGVVPNNAFLASYVTYTDRVPMFERMLAESKGEPPDFYARVKQLASERSSQDPSSALSR